ncbi:hypothetical protein [Meiothermus ruber]|uniref:Uncharacterized protein n=1 Tax=Meiothermus ruber (strain ATCC 35948 / DSM 1279 / VKM B-1258 / 21) TaxID=504728 RepID=D3PTE6_MEIRD|nr:hypothetical protein [Meiothermus ruber]ADD28729.1 hypothetical protein Mrub_1973 [Meiothermus ruber DSM 1279]AGK05823.1 hypothetical protein K649_12685 [Meiothermus ruber DSM 1279]
MDSNLERWRAEHLAKYLWWVATGLKTWQVDGTGHAPEVERSVGRIERPGYLLVRVMELPAINIPRHTLRLWRSDYKSLLEQTDPAIKDEWAAFLHRARWSSLWYYDSHHRRVRAANEHRGLTAWTLELARRAEVVRTDV